MPIVKTAGLMKVYRLGGQEVRALNGVDLDIEAGEFVAIMGRSGTGKTTLLNVIGCLDRPTKGQVFLDGVEVSRLPGSALPRVRREKLGFVFQEFNLIPTLTALENVMLPLKYAGVGRSERALRSREALEAIGLGARLWHRPAHLSGGEQQRVAVARALVNRPAVVLADEPTGELDSQTARGIIQMMKQLNRERGQTFIVVTHDPMVAGESSRLIEFDDGRIKRDQRQS